MADHIATRKSTFTSASTSRMTKTHSPIVNRSQKRVSVYSNGVTYGAMSKQTQAEPCVLYIRVSTTRQANQGVSLKAQIARGKLHAQYQNFLLPNTHIFIDRGVSAKTPLWSRPVGKQMKAFIAKHKIKQIIASEWTDCSEILSIVLLQSKNWRSEA